jgi:hypothetical protein
MISEPEHTIDVGMDVVDVDGEKVGSVDHLVGDHIAVARGWLFPTDYLIPLSEVSTVDSKVHLKVSKDQALARGFEPVAGRGSAQEVLANDDPVDSIGIPEE